MAKNSLLTLIYCLQLLGLSSVHGNNLEYGLHLNMMLSYTPCVYSQSIKYFISWSPDMEDEQCILLSKTFLHLSVYVFIYSTDAH